jgi:serine/threonine-protein kinase
MTDPTPTRAPSAPLGPGPAGPDLTGRTLDDFRVLRRLGQGGMGQVYLAEQVSLKRKVALKVLLPGLAASSSALQRFKAEAEAVARATHANIVQVYAIGEVDGLPYMALEYVEGRNLREHLARRGPPDVLLALGIMRQVAAALGRAGELGIVHRDIKPDNILLTRKGEVKVADFGLSRCLVADQPTLHLTQTGVTLGTPLYMSPEQVEGKPLDPRTDIYSFGVTCYHMLAGQPPFRGETAFEVALQHVRAEPIPLGQLRPDLPQALCAIVHRMMHKDPACRYQTGRELLRDLLRLRETLSGHTALLPPATVVVPAEQAPAPPTRAVPSGRRRLLPWLFALSLVLALAGGALLRWVRRESAAPAYPPAVPPGEVSEAEKLLGASQKKEQTLREAAELYLGSPGNAVEVAAGFELCLKLGLFYLEAERLDDAERWFRRLEESARTRPYRVLGRLGRGIVRALRSEPRESNQLFREVFAAPPFPGLVLRRPESRKQDVEVQLWQNPHWRYWMARALDYNARNGLPDNEVPWLLHRLVPVRP